MKKILWITPRWPNPANDGAKIATLELLKHLDLGADCELTLLALLPENEAQTPLTQLKARKIHFIPRTLSKHSRFLQFLTHPFRPVTFGSFLEGEFVKQARTFVLSETWDSVVFDGIHAAVPFMSENFFAPKFSFPITSCRFYYRAHNVEWSLWEQVANRSSFLKKIALSFQAFLVKQFEKALIDSCTHIFPVSDEDGRQFKLLSPKSRFTTIRIGQNFPKGVMTPREYSNSIHLGFIGRVDWLPNREGLEWFIKEVWIDAHTKNPNLNLFIAGTGDDRYLIPYQSMPGVHFLGQIPNVEQFYQDLDAMIVPLFIGSGTRVKVIEASKFGRVCVSTALGVEGCPLLNRESYLNAETREQWVETLVRLDQKIIHSMGLKAYEAIQSSFDSESIAVKLSEIIR